ncbi:pentapeptide repeat-containing protein [Mumia sp. zg.B21]|uniref:pentapeptide repeat-containing protein n=1 Tax=Mumia sp. zg.B21 TaxID=2855447 RepID=UPI001C6F384F|nr:pentapeptide repeat-containing protein [Mumia sp. zg.B21]MBW9211772.1 pentapeptide repeat-containing protein [Mumia sp. zg.B21]
MTSSRVWGFMKAHPIATAIALTTAAVAILVSVPLVLVDISGGGRLKGKDLADAVANERRTVLATLAGIAAAIGLFYTAMRHHLDRENHTLALENHKLALESAQLDRESAQLGRDSNVTERYTRAVEQLGHTSIAIRLGGLYSLDRIAVDSERDRDTILEVICAFVRDRTRARPSATPETDAPTAPETDVAAALSLLTRPKSWINSTVDINGANLTGANLFRANLTRANLGGANLGGANLTRANLTGAYLGGVTLTRAKLTGANLTGAYLGGVTLTRAKLTGADLTNAFLTNADLTGADFTNADLNGAVGLDTVVGLP